MELQALDDDDHDDESSVHSDATWDYGEDDEAEAAMEALAFQLEQEEAKDVKMQLMTEERDWALQLKAAIESCPDMDNLSDMTIACLAIATEGDLERAMDQAYQMQEMNKEYSILDTLEDGLRHVKDIYIPNGLGDRFCLTIEPTTAPETGGYTFVGDISKLDLRNYQTPQQIQRFFKGLFYQMITVTPDLMAVRAGVHAHAECEGWKWKHNMMDLNFFKRMLRDTAGILPIKHQKMYFYNAPMLFNTMASMAKSALPKHVTDSFQMGCRCPLGERLDTFYNLPTREIAEARLHQRLEGLLRKRYSNEKNFVL